MLCCCLQTLGLLGDVDRMVGLLRGAWLHPERAQPNFLTYNSAIAACCRHGRVFRAIRLQHEMVRPLPHHAFRRRCLAVKTDTQAVCSAPERLCPCTGAIRNGVAGIQVGHISCLPQQTVLTAWAQALPPASLQRAFLAALHNKWSTPHMRCASAAGVTWHPARCAHLHRPHRGLRPGTAARDGGTSGECTRGT